MQQDNIGYLLHQTAFRIDRISDQVLQERLGIGYAQFKILMVLQTNEQGLTQRAIAGALGQTEAGISRQVSLLASRGLIVRKISRQNRRARYICLTAKGQLAHDKSVSILNSYHQPMFESLDEKQRQQLHNLLKRLEQQLTS